MLKTLYPDIQSIIRDIISTFIWLYAVIKLFVFDIDNWLISAIAPQWIWIHNFKLLIFLSALIVAAILLGKKNFPLTIIYIVSFPVVMIFWKLPRALILSRSWTLAIVMINAAIGIFNDIIYKMSYFVVAGVSTLIILISTDHLLLYVAAWLIGICIFCSYVMSGWSAYRPPQVLKLYRRLFEKLAEFGGTPSSELPVAGRRISTMEEEEVKQYVTYLQPKVAVGQLCGFFARELRRYNDSEIHIASSIYAFFRLVSITLFGCALMYFAIYKIDTDSIVFSGAPGVFDWIYLSFDNMLFNMNSSAQLISAGVKMVSMFERLMCGILVFVVLAIFFEFRKKKHAKHIEEAIQAASKAAGAVSDVVRAEFTYLTLSEAALELRGVENSLYASASRLFSSPSNSQDQIVDEQ